MANRLAVQPATFIVASVAAGEWYRAIPLVGAFAPAIAGVADANNLLSNSPPTLLEEYQLYSYSIGWGILLTEAAGDFATIPNVTAELAFLVNGQVAYVTSDGPVPTTTDAGPNAWAGGSWVSDLVNPIILEARDRLSLRMGFFSDTAASGESQGLIGCEVGPIGGFTFGPVPFDSTISYNTIRLPGRRRL